MSITLSPSKAAYLARVAEGLADLPPEDREEVIQDLESHLAELEDLEVERVLGSPKAFVAEFRSTAGLDDDLAPPKPGLIERWRAVLDRRAARLGEVTHWQTFRPAWVWTRGWLLVCAWSFLYDYEGFSRFPIPTVGQSTATGLVLVAAATALSAWLDQGPGEQRWRAVGSTVFSSVAALALVGMLLNPMPTYSQLVHIYEEPFYTEQLTAPDGSTISNVYAYDSEGNPVEVLLFDQDGRPLLTFPPYVYDEASGTGSEATYWDQGTVDFPRDQFGRIIPNLYPLVLTTYDEYGELVPMAPPSLGLSRAEELQPTDIGSVPTTTLGLGR